MSIRKGRVLRVGRGIVTDGLVSEIWWTEKNQVKRVMLRNEKDKDQIRELKAVRLGISEDGGGVQVDQLKYAGQSIRAAGDQLGAAETCLEEAGNLAGAGIVRAALDLLRKHFELDGGMCHGGAKSDKNGAGKSAEARQ